MSRVIAIVQARMGSSRLPGKVLEQIGGRPALVHIVERLRDCETLGGIVVATTTERRDDAIVLVCGGLRVPFHRGPDDDVLARYIGAVRQIGLDGDDIVVRITADCPLVDAGVVDRTVRALRTSKYDWASNAVVRTFPLGLDVEALYVDTLFRLHRRASTPQDREHVTWGAYHTEPERYLTRVIEDDVDNHDLRWTLDTAEDLAHIRDIYDDVDYRTLIERCRKRAA